jgi:hypothetical protein
MRQQRAWKVVACMTMAPPGTEQFYLRMLLNHVCGSKSFNDIRTHNGTEYPAFKEAALAKGLLHNGAEYDAYMQEATLSAMPNQIRRLFVTLLTFGDPAGVEGLFHRHFDAMAEDQRGVTEWQKQNNIIQILNSHLQPFSIQMSNLIDIPPFIGDA